METESEETYRESLPMDSYVELYFSGFSIKHEELTKLLGI